MPLDKIVNIAGLDVELNILGQGRGDVEGNDLGPADFGQGFGKGGHLGAHFGKIQGAQYGLDLDHDFAPSGLQVTGPCWRSLEYEWTISLGGNDRKIVFYRQGVRTRRETGLPANRIGWAGGALK